MIDTKKIRDDWEKSDQGKTKRIFELCDAYDELKSKTEWRPIETAPKDGATIIAFGDPITGINLYRWIDGSDWYCDANSQDGMGFGYCQLSHWLPLPDAPEEE